MGHDRFNHTGGFPRPAVDTYSTGFSSGMSGIAIAGIVIAVLFVVVPVIISLVICCVMYKKHQRSRVTNQGMVLNPHVAPISHVNPNYHHEQGPPTYSEVFNKSFEASPPVYSREEPIGPEQLPPIHIQAQAL